uniref:Mesothelin a n=2 Tax=Monopterus albus TaxID=43700 RepID=A0A3Q3PY66_MONAL
MNVTQSTMVLNDLNTFCTNLDPQISAALVSNFGTHIDAAVLAALGNQSTGMSIGQINKLNPADLYSTLNTLSNVQGWSEGQAKAVVQALISSGLIQINSQSDLEKLGSLVVGVPASVIHAISGSQLISASRNPTFLENLMASPDIIQQTFVTQIISVNSSSEAIIQNVPDQFATQIPPYRLVGFSNNADIIRTLNKKTWKAQQAELFFNIIADESATAVLGGPNNVSSSVLQGFTCTGVRNVNPAQVEKLIKACRRTGKNRVPLEEAQLTCMYNYVKGESDANSFSLFPPDVLMYYDYSVVPQDNCRDYFTQMAGGNFFVFSSVLSYLKTNLFANARNCLEITNTVLTKDNIIVLGNMCCTLDGPYITNSDPYILEQMKNCPDLTPTQSAAVQTILLSGTSQYGATSTWNDQTLMNLEILPLHMNSDFFNIFDKVTTKKYFKGFLPSLKRKGVGLQKMRRLKEQIRLHSSSKRSKRAAVNECTVGIITAVTISDETFPYYDYSDINQFDSCLSAAIVKDNLDVITSKVDTVDYLRIVLNKLNEAYPSSVPEDQVQLLGPASRVATTDDINKWNITQIDTLSALMDSSNGPWDPSLAKAIITKYLSKAENKLGSAELNVIGGVNLCSLDIDVLKSISTQSIK